MKRFIVFVVFGLFFSVNARSELLYNSATKYIKSGCQMNTSNLGTSSNSRYLYSLTCAGVGVAYIQGYYTGNTLQCYPSGLTAGYGLIFKSCNDIGLGSLILVRSTTSLEQRLKRDIHLMAS